MFSFVQLNNFLEEKREADMNFTVDFLQFDLVELILFLKIFERFLYPLIIDINFIDFFNHLLCINIWFGLESHRFYTTRNKTLEVVILYGQIFDIRIVICLIIRCNFFENDFWSQFITAR